jgi:hypothetical protein
LLPEVIKILKSSFLTSVTHKFQTYLWFNVAQKDIMFYIQVDHPSIFLCSNEFAILLQRNEHTLCVDRFKQNQLNFEGIILKTGIFRVFLWTFHSPRNKRTEWKKIPAFFKRKSLWHDLWYQQCWYSEKTKRFTDSSLWYISFSLLGNDNYDKKARDVLMLQIRMYRSEVHYFFVLLKYNDNKTWLSKLVEFLAHSKLKLP